MRGDRQKDLQRCILWLHKPILLGKLAIGKTLEPLEPETWPGNRPQDGKKAEKRITAPCELSSLC